MPTTPLESDNLAVSDEDIWSELASRLKTAIEAEGNNRTKALEALEFLDGHQWPDDLYNKRKIARRPSLTINHTRTFRMRVVNNMRQERPRIKVHPVGDGADIDKANVVSGLIRHIETRSNAGVAYDTAGASAVDIGWGYARVKSEFIDPKSFDQELCIVPIRNTFTTYMDPASVMPAGEDAEWVIITEKMKRTEFKRQYPEEKMTEFVKTGVGDFQSMWETKTEIRLAEYYRVTRRNDILVQFSDGSAEYASDLKKPAIQALIAKLGVTETGRRQSFKKTIEWFKVNGSKIVDRRSVDDNPLPDEWIPVIRCEGNVLDINGEVRRKGMIEDLMDPARMFNYWRTSETEQLALSSKAPWVGPAGFMAGHPEWADANQTPYSALEYEVVTIEQPDGSFAPVGKPERQQAIEVPAGFVQAAQSAQQDLMSVAGMPHDPGKDNPSQVVSGVALQRRQALSDIGHYQYYDNQTRFIAQIGRILLQLIPHYYSTQRMQRIIGEDGVPTMEAINTPQQSATDPAVTSVKNDLTVGKFDVVMDTGPGYDTKRQEGAESMIAMLATPLGEEIAKVGGDIVLRSMDWTGADALADRLMPKTPDAMKKVMDQLPKQAQNIVQSFMGQLNQANQKITQLEADLKYGLTKTHTQEATKMAVEHLRDQRAERDTDADNATKREDTHVKAVTAHNVAEIRAGAQLLNTHVEAAHNKAAAADALKAAESAEKETV
jgi:hypothetical protein